MLDSVGLALVISFLSVSMGMTQTLNILHYYYTVPGQSSHRFAKAQAIKSLDSVKKSRDWFVAHTEDPAYFTDKNLEKFDVILFDNVCCTQKIFETDAQRASVEKFMRSGKGYVGLHAVAAAARTNRWAFLAGITANQDVGGAHPNPNASAVLRVDERNHYSTQNAPEKFVTHVTEWFHFPVFPKNTPVTLLVSIQKGTAGAGEPLEEDLPVSWCQYYEGARAFYSSLGHDSTDFTHPDVSEHIWRALEWAGGRAPQTGVCGEPAVTDIQVGKPGQARVFADRYFSLTSTPAAISGATLEPGRYQVTVYDSRGKAINSMDIKDAAPFSFPVTRSGVYTVKLSVGDYQFTRLVPVVK